MHTNTNKIIKVMENIASPTLAESWDNVGLMVGHANKMVENILVTLEVTESVIEEAISKNIDLIISHHPLIYKPLKKLTTDDPIASMVIKLLLNDINLYVAHTNLDAAQLGTCHYITELLGLNRVDYIEKNIYEPVYKIQTFVPITHESQVKQAMITAGAGSMGDYSECTFTTQGEGQFKPNENAHPFIGEVSVLEKVAEVKIEAVVIESNLNVCIEALMKVHPYETPAYDVILLENKINAQGVGQYGFLEKQMTLESLSEQVKQVLNISQVKVIGDLNRKVNRVAVITGAGADYYKEVLKKADVLITGDIKYHEAQYAKQLNLAVIDAGHFETENVYIGKLKTLLDKAFEEKSYDVQVMVSEVDVNPFKIV